MNEASFKKCCYGVLIELLTVQFKCLIFNIEPLNYLNSNLITTNAGAKVSGRQWKQGISKCYFMSRASWVAQHTTVCIDKNKPATL